MQHSGSVAHVQLVPLLVEENRSDVLQMRLAACVAWNLGDTLTWRRDTRGVRREEGIESSGSGE